jgi:hypothetical protein
VVFGFALTLVVVSVEVPKTFAELHRMLGGFLPFAVVFYFLMAVWFAHYKFFRRFGTHDFATIWLNGMLLFVVLFYVYPLKFLFTFLTYDVLGETQTYIENNGEVRELLILYAVGFTAIYLLIAALYWNGLRQRVHLGLNDLEVMLTKTYIVEDVGVALIGVLSGVTAALLPVQYVGLSGWVYVLIGVFKWVYGARTRRRVERQRALDGLTRTPA